MNRQVSHDVLRRMVSPPPPAPEDVPITSSRAMRLAVTRAADKTHDIAIGVLGLREELVTLDDLLGMLTPDLMLIAMTEDAAMVGVAAMDLQLRSALIEAQTIGGITASAPDDRAPTRTDASMATPMLQAIITQMGETTARTPLDGWGQGLSPGGLVADARAAGLILADRSYRVIRLTLDLQAGARQGDLLFALPDHLVAAPVTEPPQDTGDWSTRFQATVNAATLPLDAELHRFKVPLFVAESLQIGQILPLTGCQVTSVKLRAGDGRKVATARLGQSGGMRAIRVEQAAQPEMMDLDQFGGAPDVGGLPMPDPEIEFAAEGDDHGAMNMDALESGSLDMSGFEEDVTDTSQEAGFGMDLAAAEALDDFTAPTAAEDVPGDDADDAAAWGLEDAQASPALDWSEEDFDADPSET